MKNVAIYILLAVATMVFSGALEQKTTSYIISKDFVVTISGTSNVHAWDEKVEVVTGKGQVIINADKSFDLQSLNIRMNVRSIKSQHGSIMNNNTYKALKGDEHPEIVFDLLTSLRSLSAPFAGNVSAKCRLSMAGVTNNLDMNVKVVMKENSSLLFEGSRKIRMSDYGVVPPTALLGRVKTGDEVTIGFRVNLILLK